MVIAFALAATPGHAMAQAVPATPTAAKAPEPLGRMFFTPSQRASLDVARKQRARTALATDKTEEVQTAAPVAQSITYDGVVRRSDGKSTVWLNSRPVHDKESAGSVVVGRIRPDGGVSLQMPQSGRTVDLKPGQSVELLSGAIEESFSRKPATPPEVKPAAKGAPEANTDNTVSNAERGRAEREKELDDATRTRREAAARPPAAPAGGAEATR